MRKRIQKRTPVQDLGLLLIIPLFPAMAQTQPQLYAGLAKSKGYVVGSKLAASGLHRFDGDRAWTHLGWNIPRVSAIAYDPQNPDIIFLACGNGAARTLDGGKSWRMTTDWRVTEAQDVAVDPSVSQHVYLATAYGVWRTSDHGETWTESNAGIEKKYTQALKVDRTQAGRVLIGTEGGVYLSTDGAASWSHAGPKEVTILDLDQSLASPSIWLAATQDRGILLSNDGGKTWQMSKGDIARAAIYAVAIDPFEPKYMSAASWGAGMFVSIDGGKSWQQRNTGLPVRNLYETVFDANQAGRLWVATFEEGVFFSDDFGSTWQDGGMHGAMVFDMVFMHGMIGQDK
ncbi:MAG: WD40/YVTN/BNR-like repeat-containing protein [bacterium]